MSFKEKSVVITGGGSGIGRAAALQFASLGAKIAIADWNENAAIATVNEINNNGGEAFYKKVDVAKYDDVKDFIDHVIDRYQEIDIALNNAGIGANHSYKTADHTLEDWDQVIAVNQTGVFYCMKEELKRGCIVNIASIAGMRALPRQIAYVASKHAVIGMTKTAALEYASIGVRINSVSPVFTNSPLLEKMFSSKEGLREKLVYSIPVGRYGEVSDIVNAIIWLCEENSSFVTGLNLPIDGGQTA